MFQALRGSELFPPDEHTPTKSVASATSPLPSLSLDDLLPLDGAITSESPGIASMLPTCVPLFPSLPAPAAQFLDLRIIKENGILGFGVVPRRGLGGVQVSTLHPQSSADRAGLRIDDCLLLIDDKDVGAMLLNDVVDRLKAVLPGEAITLRVFRPGSSPPSAPPAKKPRLPAPDAALKKQLDALRKELAVVTAEKTKLAERNAALRKRVQDVVIQADEKLLAATKAQAAIIERLGQDKMALAQALATLQAQVRVESRAVFDAAANAEAHAQREASATQLAQLLDADRRRKDARKSAVAVLTKLAGLHAAQLEDAIAARVAVALADIAAARAATKISAFGIDAGSPTFAVAVELCRPTAVLQLLKQPLAFDANGFPALAPLRLSWPADRAAAVFGSRLVHEERAGVHLAATGPVEIKYDPTTELLEMTWKWTEHSIIREIGRSIRLA
ncbi:hypothetical protein ACHHYP_04435 [Achlya hypogyna]|uniref:PDZ domain-containing protein n=1 Tax=Achlya hypogyna TaxID=1202772 RepID=A0A1V9Z1A1_ACHHY|nr:hypothetical protein ACHHYP_04435 [Achlya hypogyna]